MSVLVAGLGNLFCTDDGFGVAVVQRLVQQEWPGEVEVRDFGIRGIHLAYQLLDPYDLVVLVDAVHRDGPPGTIYTIETEQDTVVEQTEGLPETTMDAHDLGPDAVLSLVPRLGGTLGRVVVVGCEPADLDAGMDLTPLVAAAVEPAAALVTSLVTAVLGVPASASGDEV